MEPLLGSYINRDHNFELAIFEKSCNIVHTFSFCKGFPILKNEKRVCPKIKSKDQNKMIKKGNVKYEPHKRDKNKS